jgi:hypothetical protein
MGSSPDEVERPGTRGDEVERPGTHGADLAALIGATIAVLFTVTNTPGAWGAQSTIIGFLLLAVLLAFFRGRRPDPKRCTSSAGQPESSEPDQRTKWKSFLTNWKSFFTGKSLDLFLIGCALSVVVACVAAIASAQTIQVLLFSNNDSDLECRSFAVEQAVTAVHDINERLPKATASPSPKAMVFPSFKAMVFPSFKATVFPSLRVTALPSLRVTASPAPKATASPAPKATASPAPNGTLQHLVDGTLKNGHPSGPFTVYGNVEGRALQLDFYDAYNDALGNCLAGYVTNSLWYVVVPSFVATLIWWYWGDIKTDQSTKHKKLDRAEEAKSQK